MEVGESRVLLAAVSDFNSNKHYHHDERTEASLCRSMSVPKTLNYYYIYCLCLYLASSADVGY